MAWCCERDTESTSKQFWQGMPSLLSYRPLVSFLSSPSASSSSYRQTTRNSTQGGRGGGGGGGESKREKEREKERGGGKGWDCPKERIKLWKEHFEELLVIPPVVNDQPITWAFDALPVKTGDFAVTELWEAIQSAQGNNVDGLDGISPEVWKLECFNDQLLEVCNRAYHGEIPDMWLEEAILPFPKKGDLGSASNNRSITLMAVGAKIYNRMFLDGLRPHLRNNQNGIRKGRSTVA